MDLGSELYDTIAITYGIRMTTDWRFETKNKTLKMKKNCNFD